MKLKVPIGIYSGEREVEFEGERYKVIRACRGGMTRQGSKLAFDGFEDPRKGVVINGWKQNQDL